MCNDWYNQDSGTRMKVPTAFNISIPNAKPVQMMDPPMLTVNIIVAGHLQAITSVVSSSGVWFGDEKSGTKGILWSK